MEDVIFEWDEEKNTLLKVPILISSAISEQEFQKKKDFFKKVATNTIAKKTKKKSLNIRLFANHKSA